MKHLLQLSLLFIICYIGNLISKLLPISFPGTLISLFLLLLLLLTNLIKEKHVAAIGDILLKNMAFLFVPSGVSIMEKYEYLQGRIGTFLFICFFTTVITFCITALSMKGMIYLQERRRS